MTRFRPCIDLHSGQVKQIVGGTLTTISADLKTNYVSKLPAGHFAKTYKDNDLTGAHVIMLGSGNEEAAKEALAEWRGGLQIGGGITDANAAQWIEWGAEKVSLYIHGNESYAFSFQEYSIATPETSCYCFHSADVQQ
jgi:phosphoribosylformimino-5-aminoimidazole carboxamide ribotide isomerase